MTETQVQGYLDYVRKSGKLNPEQLAGYEAHVRDTVGPDAPGFSPENPASEDIYQDDGNRMKASFGDPEGIQKAHLLAAGYTPPQKNGAGDLVTTNPSGRYVKDDTRLFHHPLNWLESAAGGSLPLAGMVGGGAVGSAANIASPAVGVPVAMAAAGGGSAGGEAIRQTIGRKLGVYSGDHQGRDLLDQGIAGVEGEGLGKLGGAVLKGGGRGVEALTGWNPTSAALARIQAAYAKGASFVSGVNKDAILRTLTHGSDVANPKSSQAIGAQMAAQLAERDSTEGKAIAAARQSLRTDAGLHPLDTSEVLPPTMNAIDTAAANLNGEGQLAASEGPAMRERALRNLTTDVSVSEELPGNWGAEPIMGPGKPIPAVKAPTFSYGAPETQKIGGWNPYEPLEIPVSPIERSTEIVSPATRGAPVQIGVKNKMPFATVNDLSHYADGLQADVGKSFQRSGLPSDGSARSVSLNQTQLGRIKELLHNFSPEYGAADAQFSRFADQSKLLKPVTNEATQQSFVDSLAKSPTRDNARAAAAELTPTSSEDILNLAANRAWKNPENRPILGSVISGKHLVQGAAVGLGGAGSYFDPHHTPEYMMLAGAGLGATSPLTQYVGARLAPSMGQQIPAALAKTFAHKQILKNSPYIIPAERK